MADKTPLQPLVSNYAETDLSGAVRALESMSEDEVAVVLQALPAEEAAAVLCKLQTAYAAEVLKTAEPELSRAIARQLEPSHAVSIFMNLPADVRERFLNELPPKLKNEIREQVTFPENSVGRVMGTRFLAFRNDLKVRQVIEKIRVIAQQRYPSSMPTRSMASSTSWG